MTWYVNYDIVQGQPWERLIVLKDRRSRRVVQPSAPRAYIKTGTNSVTSITCSLTSEPGITLSLTSDQTRDLPTGEMAYDVFAVTTSTVEKQVSKGLVTVSAMDRITPEEDAEAMQLRFPKNTDFRRTFTWNDASGNLQTATDGYMQAVDANAATVLDLRWYATAPDESTTIGLTPAMTRGYITPSADSTATVDLHISDANDIAAGSYTYDLFLKDGAGDWDRLVQGTLVVESAVSSPPS